MSRNEQDQAQIAAELEQTRIQLDEALETIEAIRNGRIDAIVGQPESGEIFRVSQSLFSDKANFDQYRLLLDSIGDGAVIIVPEGTIVYCNAAFTLLVRRHMEEVVGADFREFLSAGDVLRFEALLERARHNAAREEVEITAADATAVTGELSLRFTLLGDLKCACMVVSDVTERKRNEEHIRKLNTELQRRVARLIEASVDAVLTTDLEFRITDANQRMTQLTGFGREELIGSHLHLLAEDSAPLLQCMQTMLAQGSVEEFEAVLSHKTGQAVPVAITGRTFKDESGRDLGIFVALRDVTERRLLHREHALLASIATACGDAIYSVTPDTLVTSWNGGAEQLLGYGAAEIVGQSSGHFVPLESRALMHDHINRAAREGGVQRFETRLQRKDRGAVEVSIRIAPMLERAGAPGEMIVIARDLTERVQFERQLIQQRDKAAAAARTNAQFLVGMSQEIRSPLSTMIGIAGLLSETALGAPQRDYLNQLQDNAGALLDAINNTLDFSRIAAGKLNLDQGDFDLEKMIQQAVTAAVKTARIADPKITIQIDGDVPRRVRADAERLRRMLIALLQCAIGFSARAAIAVRSLPSGESEGRQSLRFEVCVPEPVGKRIAAQWRGFEQNREPEPPSRWTGLPLMAELVRLMGGESGVLDQPAGGSSLWFTANFAAAAPPREAPASTEFRLQGLPVLIVDDKPSHREIMKNRLASWKMAPETAGSAAEALRLLRLRSRQKLPYAMAVLEAEMAQMDGIELARQIRREAEIARTPLLMLSAVGGAADLSTRIAGLDIKAVLLEPVEQSDLRQRIIGALADEQPG